MNWLAHILLSENNVDFQLGNVLADPFKGKLWDGASKGVESGINMHKRIDVFTDSHSSVSASKSRLGDKGYLKGVVVDITYDYFLSKHWGTYSSVGLSEFLAGFYQEALVVSSRYPDAERDFTRRMIESNWLASYGSLKGLESAFKRIDARLSDRIRKRECASDYLPKIVSQLGQLESDFLTFFPDLQQHVRENLDPSQVIHWREMT